MNIDKLLRYSCGYVHFKAENGFTERLLNLCAYNNINLYELKNTDVGFEAQVLSVYFKRIVEFAEKTNVAVEELGRSGVPVAASRYRKRWGIALGVVAFLLFLFISQNFVWQIEVVGNKKVSTSLILSELEAEGIHKLSYIPSLNFRDKKHELMMRLPELSWLSVNISGCRLEVEVTERNVPPMIDEAEPSDIVASKTGQIRYMEVYNGVKQTDVNYTVTEGQTLVSGRFVTKQGNEMYVHSSAKIIAEVQFDKSFSIDIDQLAKEYTGKVKNRYYLDIMSCRIPLFIATKFDKDYDVIEQRNPMVLFSNELPFGYIKKQYRFYDKKKQELSEQEAVQILKDSVKQYEISELKDSAIINREESIVMKDNVVTMTVAYIAEQDIAKQKTIDMGMASAGIGQSAQPQAE